jgi:serine/threonine protein kinase
VQQLHHPAIVPVFRYGQENGYCFFVMKLIHGASLDRVIRSLGAASNAGLDLRELIPDTNIPSSPDTASAPTLPKQHPTANTQTPLRLTPAAWPEFARIALQAAHALHAAHSAGICHNDIKPGNILLENTGHVWVTDFGLSQPLSPPQTLDIQQLPNAHSILGPMTRRAQAQMPDASSQSCGGTLKYMAPERLLGQQSEAADLYSLGATLYELCLQCTPFDHEQRDQLRQMILEKPPMAPSDLCRDFPRGLETIILNCLEKNPANRYATARQLIQDLLRFTRGRHIRRTRSSWLSAGLRKLRTLFR